MTLVVHLIDTVISYHSSRLLVCFYSAHRRDVSIRDLWGRRAFYNYACARTAELALLQLAFTTLLLSFFLYLQSQCKAIQELCVRTCPVWPSRCLISYGNAGKNQNVDCMHVNAMTRFSLVLYILYTQWNI